MISRMKMLEQMWEMQGELNLFVGRDTIGIGRRPATMRSVIRTMTREYLDEAMNECHEAKENYYHKWWVKEVIEDPSKRFTPIDLAKIKVEIIDVFHFLISACHLNCYFFYQDSVLSNILAATEACMEGMDNEKCYFYYNEVIEAAHQGRIDDCFVFLFAICQFHKISFEDILEVYKMKWEKNKKRYETGYSVATKNEKDNEEIEERIRQNKC